MWNILFVDDELKILKGLERLLRPQREKWDMAFAPGGAGALEALGNAPFDVIVTDMSMPGMDGARLLQEVHRSFPELIRIVLSGHTDRGTILRALPFSHQFLAKPCDPPALLEAMERALSLQALLRKEAPRKVVGLITCLPSIPGVHARFREALGDPRTSLGEVAGIVEMDIALCARVLQLVNSAFFGLARRTTSIKEAVNHLGIELLKGLSLSADVFGKFEVPMVPGFSPEALSEHSVLTARLARKLLPEGDQSDDAFMAGMLHDLGKLILATRLPDHLPQTLELARRKGISLPAAEEEQHGFTHAEVGAYFLGLWGLPNPVVEAAAYHHVPARAGKKKFDALAAVHVANALVNEKGSQAPGGPEPPEAIDAGMLAALGVLDRLPAWRAEAEEMLLTAAL